MNAAWRWGLVALWVSGFPLGFASAGAAAAEPGAPEAVDGETGLQIETEVDARPAPPPDVAPVDLERLLKLPQGYGAEVETRGGATESRWRGRFEKIRAEIETVRTELAQTEKQLESASDSSSAWQVSAPGADSPENSPLSFRLRQQVKEQRATIEASERALRALEVEADLAEVPPEWRE